MEQKTQQTLAEMREEQIDDIQRFYKKAYSNLENITLNSPEAAPSLLKIINRTLYLKTYGISEDQLGKFAFIQETSLKNNVRNYMHSPYNGPHHVSILFAKIKQYNDLLTEKKFITPTKDEYTTYLMNQRIHAAIAKADSFKLPITMEHLKQKDMLNTIDSSVAAQEFHELITDIHTMRCINQASIKDIATILYGTVADLS